MTKDNIIFEHHESVVPDYYRGTACADLIGDLPFNVACIMKYVWRHEFKDKKKDIEKAIRYCIMEKDAIGTGQIGLMFAEYDFDRKMTMIYDYSLTSDKEYKPQIFGDCLNYLYSGKISFLDKVYNILISVLKEEYGG